jgi:hypothetical protein
MGSSPYLLRRLDATTFNVTAEREFSGYRPMYILAAPER